MFAVPVGNGGAMGMARELAGRFPRHLQPPRYTVPQMPMSDVEPSSSLKAATPILLPLRVPPSITVLVPTFNREPFLAECLESLLGQTLPPAQILVVNDGSSDGTPAVLELFKNQIQILETPQLGKSGALNAGLAKVTGDYLWIFDDDDVALPDALARFVEPLEAHAEYAFSYSTYFYSHTRPTDNRIGAVFREQHIPDVHSTGMLIPLLENNYLGGAALFTRTSVYSHVGSFDPDLIRSQDYEMALRIVRRFRGVRVTGGATFHYRQHPGVRGSHLDRFPSPQRDPKWRQYDRHFFRRLHRELPLSAFLPPGANLPQATRQAILRRLSVFLGKGLLPEAISDLRALTHLEDAEGRGRVLDRSERSILQDLAGRYCKMRDQNVLGDSDFLNALRILAPKSALIQDLRDQLCRKILRAGLRKPPRLPAMLRWVRRAYTDGFE